MKKGRILILAGALILLFVPDQAPEQEVNEARRMILEMEKSNSVNYAGTLSSEAKNAYDSAMKCWERENERFFLFRDFTMVREYSQDVVQMSSAAIQLAGENRSVMEESLEKQIQGVRKTVEDFENYYSSVPLNPDQRSEWVKGRLLFSEAILAYNDGKYNEASVNLDYAQEMLEQVLGFAVNMLEEYFTEYPVWMKRVDRAIENSKRSGQPCIVIDKYGRKCMLYEKGEKVMDFHADLGSNWLGDKQYQGDKATPEGVYKVIGKKSSGETRYYKALLLNYPNDEDRKRYSKSLKDDQIPGRAGIGNLIEIHGMGGKGVDWTDGCIAINNEEMDKLFASCNRGTEVVIVGSLIPLENILNTIR